MYPLLLQNQYYKIILDVFLVNYYLENPTNICYNDLVKFTC